MEGISIATPALGHFVVPLTIAVLIGLFALQHRGTESIGALFGPVTIAWFAVLAVLGMASLVRSPEILASVDPRHAVRFFAHNGSQRIPDPRLGVPRGDGRRGPLRGHGPLRPPSDPHRLVRLRAACAPPQLLRAGSAPPPRARLGGEPLLSPRPVLGPLSARRARDGGDGDRLAGHHQRGVFPHVAGSAARPAPPRARRAHLRGGDRPHLHPRRQQRAPRLDGGAGPRVRDLDTAGGGLRRGGHRHHGDHHHPRVHGDAPPLELEPAASRRRGRGLPRDRPGVPCREPREGGRRRMVPAPHRGRRRRAHDDLAHGPAAPRGPPARAGDDHLRGARPRASSPAGPCGCRARGST